MSTATSPLATRARARLGRRAVLLALALTLSELPGCAGITDPYRGSPTTSQTSTQPDSSSTPADSLDPAPERGGTIPQGAQAAQSKLARNAGSASRHAALERYAALYVNWDAAHVIAIQRQLASISVGQARAQALQAAAGAARDPQLIRSHVSNTGQVLAIAHGERGAAGGWVIVTRELTTGQGDYAGLPPTVHVIYAQLTHTTQGWLVSQWQPQN